MHTSGAWIWAQVLVVMVVVHRSLACLISVHLTNFHLHVKCADIQDMFTDIQLGFPFLIFCLDYPTAIFLLFHFPRMMIILYDIATHFLKMFNPTLEFFFDYNNLKLLVQLVASGNLLGLSFLATSFLDGMHDQIFHVGACHSHMYNMYVTGDE
ncbi:hypothetical protein ACJX0J_030840, partial [Zea mays]